MYENKGLTGLVNLGNTCYMNSAIQCLSNTIELTHYFLSKEFIKTLNKDHKYVELGIEWYKLLNGIWADNCIVSPNSFDRTVKKLAIDYGLNLNFTPYSQNDVHEFITFFIDNLHEIFSKKVNISITGKIENDLDKMAYDAMLKWKDFFKDNYSVIIELFYGQLISKIETEKKLFSSTYDPICYFSLSIPDKKDITIYDCFDLMCKSEILDGDNKYKCDKTNEYFKAKKTLRVWRFPKILIICIKRFTNFGQKIVNNIDFPIENLDLKDYCDGYSKYKSKYDLIGVCNHSGGLGGGHYYAYCKNMNGKWYNYNDSSVNEIQKSGVVTNNAYCLFYRNTELI